MALFTNDFEEGDFSAWTSVVGAASAVEHVHPHHNLHNALFANWIGNCQQNLVAGVGTIYVRMYVRLEDLNGAGNVTVMMILSGASWDMAYIQVARVGANNVWQIYYRDTAGAFVTDTSATTLAADQYYCLEVKRVKNDHVEVFVDGISILTSSVHCVNTNSQFIRVGEPTTGEVVTVYVDCVVIDSSYIGPESAGGAAAVKRRLLMGVGLAAKTPQFKPKGLTFPKLLPRVM